MVSSGPRCPLPGPIATPATAAHTPAPAQTAARRRGPHNLDGSRRANPIRTASSPAAQKGTAIGRAHQVPGGIRDGQEKGVAMRSRTGTSQVASPGETRATKVHAFTLYVVGEGIEKKTGDFAAEVAAQVAAAKG